jgi:hypothetical protein
MTVFIGLLQKSWESGSRRTLEVWSFPAMLLMLGSPVFLYLIAQVLCPEKHTAAGRVRRLSPGRMTDFGQTFCRSSATEARGIAAHRCLRCNLV